MPTYSFRSKSGYTDDLVLVRFQEDSINEVIAQFRGFLLATGFTKETVDEYVPDPYEVDDEPEEKVEGFLE
jgi:hypothetical protein